MRIPHQSKRWLPLYFTHFFGVFNDNLLKGIIAFLAVRWAPEAWTSLILAATSFLLVGPFLIGSALGARLSVRYPKAKVVSRAKWAELLLLAIATASIQVESLWGLLACLTAMGMQSAFHAPSKMGLIAEMAEANRRSKATGGMEMLSFLGVLLGMLVAGSFADHANGGTILCIALLVAACLGLCSAHFLRWKWPTPPSALPTANPVGFFRAAWRTAVEPSGLRSVILGEGAFWMIGATVQLVMLVYLPEAYGLTASKTAAVVAGMAVAVALGCWTTGRALSRRFEMGWVSLASWGMVILLVVAAVCPLPLGAYVAVLLGVSFLSGVFKVPLHAWIQQRIPQQDMGSVLALANMVSFSFILLAAGLFAAISLWFPVRALPAVLAAMVVLVALVVSWVQLPALVRIAGWLLARSLIRLRVRGVHQIPVTGGALLVANHSSYLDFLLVSAAVPRQVRFVMLKDVYDQWYLKPLLRKLGMIPVHARKGGNDHQAFNRAVQETVAAGHCVCIFAEGTVSRTGQLLGFRKGVEFLSKGLEAPVIPIHFDNVPGTPFSFTAGQRRMQRMHPRNWRRPVLASVGAPEARPVLAVNLRQRMLEMEAEAFGQRPIPKQPLNLLLFEAMHKRSVILRDAVRERSSAELLFEAKVLAMRLEQLPGHALGIAFPHDLNLQVALVAGLLARKTLVPIDPSLDPAEASRMLQLAECDQVLTGSDVFRRWGKLAGIALHHHELEHGRGSARCWSRRLYTKLSGWHPLPFPNGRALLRLVTERGGTSEIGLNQLFALRNGMRQVTHVQGIERVLLQLPSHRTWGAILPLLLVAEFNLDVILAEGEEALELLLEHRPEAAVMHASLLPPLLESPIPELAFLQQLHVGAGKISDQWREACARCGVPLFQSLGLDETTSVLSLNMPDFDGMDLAGFPMFQQASDKRSVGRPLPGLAVRVVDPSDFRRLLAPGEVGRILVKGAAAVGQLVQECAGNWRLTPLMGSLDEQGFLRLAQ